MEHDDFLANVTRLMELRDLEAQIAAEQAQVRAEIARYLEAQGTKGWTGLVAGKSVKVTRQERTQVTYDEPLLRQRLGDRFRRIITLDRKQLAERENQVLEWLGDHALEVARVDRARVKEALEKGEIQTEEFRGAFDRKVTYTVVLNVSGGGDDR